MIPADKFELISKFHNADVGHHGINRTIQLMDTPDGTGVTPTENVWIGRKAHVKEFIRRCDCCQMMSEAPPPPVITHPFTLSSYTAMERLNIDTIGPLPEDNRGNKYILVILDGFTRFVRLTPTIDATANSAATALLSFVCEYGFPRQIITDGGPQFDNDTISTLMELTKCDKITSAPYSHEENGLVERANREVGRHLRNIVYDKRVLDTWSLYVHSVQRIMNSVPHRSTRYAPVQLMFGSRVDLQKGLIIPWPAPSAAHIALGEWQQATSDEHTLLSDQARANLSALDRANMEARVAKRRREPTDMDPSDPELDTRTNEQRAIEYSTFKPGVLVMAQRRDRRPNKLASLKEGPFKVISQDRDMVMLRNVSSRKEKPVHISNLTLYVNSKQKTALGAAAKAQNSWVVKAIHDHKPKSNVPSRPFAPNIDNTKFWFHTEWEGETDKTWVKYKQLEQNLELHKYLRANNGTRLIPRRFRSQTSQETST